MTLIRNRPSLPLIGGFVELVPPLADHTSQVMGLAIDGDRLFATTYYAHNSDTHSSPATGTLHVRDRVTLAELAPPIEVGWQPQQVVVNPVARRIYVLNYGAASQSISIVGLDSLQVEGELEVEGGAPLRMAVDEGHNRLYVLVHPTNEVVGFDCSDHSVIGRTGVGEGVTDMAYDDANRLLYVTRFRAVSPFDDELVIVDTSLLATAPPHPIALALPRQTRPRRVVHHPGLDRVYILTEGVAGATNPGITEYDHGANTLTPRVIQGGPVGLGLDPFHETVHLLTNVGLNSYSTNGLTPSTNSPMPVEPLPGALSVSLVVDPETSSVAVGDAAGRVTLVHPDLALGDAPHAAAGAPPVMIDTGAGMGLFVVGNDDKLRMARWTESTDWDFALRWAEAPDTVPAGTPLAAISRTSGTWEVFCVRSDRQLWRLSGHADGTIDGWTALGGQFPLRAHVSAISRHTGHWTVFAVGDDGRVFSAGGIDDGIGVGPIEGGPALTPGAPLAAVSRKSDHWDLVVLAADGQTWNTWWSVDNGPGGWGNRGGTFAPGTPLTGVARHSQSVELFAVRSDGQVVTLSWHSTNGWSGWRAVRNADNAAPVGAAVGAMCRNADCMDIFVVRDDQQIWTTGWVSGWSPWKPLGGRAAQAGARVATRPRPDTDQWMHICWVGDGGSVETAWWNRVQPLDGWSITNGVRLRVVTESVRFDDEVATDTSHLSGQVATRLWRDGNYLVSGHMHNDWIDPYRFSTQSAVLSEQGYSVLNVGAGHLDGTTSDSEPDRHTYWNDVGHDDVVAGAYDELAAGASIATSVSKNIGIGGGLSSIVHAVFHDFLDPLIVDPLRTINRAGFGIGEKATKLLHVPVFLGPQSLFTYTGAVGWATGFGYVIPLLPWYEELGTLDPLIAHRQLEEHEYNFADRVFMGKLPPRDRIWITDGLGLHKHPFSQASKGREFVMPLSDADDGPFLVNLGRAADDPTTYTRPEDDYKVPGQLFIHELTHVWDLFNTGLDWRKWLLRGAKDGNYTPPPATTPWADFGIEQKAATVDEWFGRHAGHGLDSNPALHDPYFKFINLVRQGITGD